MAKVVIAIAAVSLLIAVYVLVSSLARTIGRNTINASEADIAKAAAVKIETNTGEAPVNENIVKIGTTEGVATSGGASGGPMSGKQVFESTCTNCHTAGVLGAPKFGDKAAWAPRFANGFDSLLHSALNGKGNMPAKGGNAGLSDNEVKGAIIYMLKEAGIDAGVKVEEEAPAKDAAKADGAAKADAPAADTNAAPASDAAKTDATADANAKAAPATDTNSEATAPAADTNADAANTDAAPADQANTAPQSPEQPAAPEQPQTPATPEQPAAPANDTSSAAPATETTPAKTESDANASAAKEAAPAAENVASNDIGKQRYEKTCHICHATGVSGAPVFGNKELWAPRIAQGMDALYNSALHGKNAMPPKGTAMDASDEEIKAAVDYMVSQVK